MAGKTLVERPALTRDRIVDAATALIERDGLAAFTMRSLGRELGVSAMAVYGHFPSRDDLLAAVLTRFMAGLDTDPVPGERWDDTMRRTMGSIYRMEVAHPQLASIEVNPSAGYAGLAEHTERIVNLHLAQGMPEPVLRQAWALVDAYLTGFVGNTLAMRYWNAQSATESAGKGDASSRPLWQSVVGDAYTEDAFAHGVEIIIQGIRSFAAPDPCEWSTPRL